MALIVENGTGLVNAESYVSVVEADARASAFDFPNWLALTSTKKEIALRKAAEFMTVMFSDAWIGDKLIETQTLDFPRTGLQSIASNVVPYRIRTAQIELALKVADGVVLIPDSGRSEKKVKVGPIEVEFESFGQSQVSFNYVANLITPFLKTQSSSSAILVRT